MSGKVKWFSLHEEIGLHWIVVLNTFCYLSVFTNGVGSLFLCLFLFIALLSGMVVEVHLCISKNTEGVILRVGVPTCKGFYTPISWFLLVDI